MSGFKIFDIAASGMSAQNLRMNLVASNMANADSISSSIDQTYKSRQPVFRAVMDQMDQGNPAVGVKMVGVIESKAPVIKEYAPNHSLADADGYIYRSNVNTVEEMANMISASRSFQNNIEVINTAKKMMSATINLGK